MSAITSTVMRGGYHGTTETLAEVVDGAGRSGAAAAQVEGSLVKVASTRACKEQ